MHAARASHEATWRPAVSICDLSGEDIIAMTPTPIPRSPHLVAFATVAVAVLGAAVLALEPTPAQRLAALAPVSAVPTCADLLWLSPRTRAMGHEAPAGSMPVDAAGQEGPPT
jgi:hypothetical protein